MEGGERTAALGQYLNSRSCKVGVGVAGCDIKDCDANSVCRGDFEGLDTCFPYIFRAFVLCCLLAKEEHRGKEAYVKDATECIKHVIPHHRIDLLHDFLISVLQNLESLLMLPYLAELMHQYII